VPTEPLPAPALKRLRHRTCCEPAGAKQKTPPQTPPKRQNYGPFFSKSSVKPDSILQPVRFSDNDPRPLPDYAQSFNSVFCRAYILRALFSGNFQLRSESLPRRLVPLTVTRNIAQIRHQTLDFNPASPSRPVRSCFERCTPTVARLLVSSRFIMHTVQDSCSTATGPFSEIPATTGAQHIRE